MIAKSGDDLFLEILNFGPPVCISSDQIHYDGTQVASGLCRAVNSHAI
jgi:hypothetical protein